jgi:transcriptional regulator with GAF, ATPase, and Fis domain
MKVPFFHHFTTLRFLSISAMALLIGFTLASCFDQATSEWAWKNIAWSIGLAGGLALCLVLFLRFRVHAQSLVKAAQQSRELAAEIAEHQQVEEALAERATRLEAVRDVAVEITRELDLTTLLGLITRRAVELVGTQSGVLYLWDEAMQVLIPQAWHGHEEWIREVRLGLGEGIAGTVAQRRAGVIVADYHTSLLAHPALRERTGATAVLAEPLLYRDRLVGVLVLLNPHGIGRPFTIEDRNLLTLFAAQAAIAIENARLHGTAVRRWEEVGALLRATHTVMADLDLQGSLTRIAEEASRIAGTSYVRGYPEIWIGKK